MTEFETRLIESEQRSLSNERRLESIESDVKEIKNDQKALYELASSVKLIAQKIEVLDDKVEEMRENVRDTNAKVDKQAIAMLETEHKLSARVTESETEPLKQTAKNVNSIRLAVVTAVCTFLATGILGTIIVFATR